MIYKDIWELLKDMKCRGGQQIYCADNVDGICGYGWVCQETEKVWSISFTDLQHSYLKNTENNIKLLKEYFSSVENRHHVDDLLKKLF